MQTERVTGLLATLAQGASEELASKAKASLDIVARALETYGGGGLALSFNGGKDCTVLLHMLAALAPQTLRTMLVVHFRPPDHVAATFPAVADFVAACARAHSCDVTDVHARTIREGLGRVLSTRPDVRAVLLGVRASDPGCAALAPFAPTDEGWPRVVRVSPLLAWRYADVWAYLRVLRVPVCSLYDEGYTSIGAVGDTRPNPLLALPDGSHAPAWTLDDEAAERLGRGRALQPIVTPPPGK